MKLVALLTVLALVVGTAGASETRSKLYKTDDHVDGVPVGGDRVVGDTIEEPWVVASLPFTGTANTCLFNHDYDEVCPYSGSISPDVVYAYAPATDIILVGDLCDGYPNSYDTKMYIYENAQGNLVACDEDGCGSALGYASYIWNTELSAGNIYYVVVDGYSGDCGNYVLKLYLGDPYTFECPPGALLEGEPDCYDGYVDMYNAGCNEVPYLFQDIIPCDGEPITYCGTSGVYYFGTGIYRDTDWYQLVTTNPDIIDWTVEAPRPIDFYILDGLYGCSNIDVVSSHTTAPGEPYTFENVQLATPGIYWLWVAPTTWDIGNYPCGETEYIWTLEGYTGTSTPIEAATWGAIKGMFR
ncbi:hypothetical protein ACFL6M_01320 [Candidatus Eisenbacteria bacterium]|uniref:Peptidase C-terminal archaeal/bacterial domain-containing protein n=1 Tax=Eiseniibacteriota bacterium TaxID=2212470 RepID=A0ABV6YJ50_UNCEI